MRTREPTCLSIGFGAFLAINNSYTTIAKRNVTKLIPCAIRHGPRFGKWREKVLKIFFSYQ
jgi:hypothetical protein